MDKFTIDIDQTLRTEMDQYEINWSQVCSDSIKQKLQSLKKEPKDTIQLLDIDIDLTPSMAATQSYEDNELDKDFYYTFRDAWIEFYNNQTSTIAPLKPPTSKQIKDLWKVWYDPDFNEAAWYADFEKNRKNCSHSYYERLNDYSRRQWNLLMTIFDYDEEGLLDYVAYAAFAEFITKFFYDEKLLNITDIDPFKLTSVAIEEKDELPPNSGIYFVVDTDKIYYIGMSQNLRNRWYDHHRQEDFESYPNLRISYLDSLPVHYLKSIETTFIEHFKPLLNIKENPLFR